MIDLAAQVATEHFAPHNRRSDSEEPRFDGERVHLIPEIGAALKVFADAGLLAGTLDEAVGGLALPTVIGNAVFAWFHAANVSTSSYPFLTLANVHLLLEHGTAEQVDTFVRPMVEGRFFGTMCLSEPEAGSSLSDVTTRAEAQPDGTYRLFGNKMWISGGDHDLTENIVHLVLAKIPGGPAGVKGISLFVVPKVIVGTGERNDVVLAGLNHKMGFRGTVNTLLNFGEGGHTPGGAPGAVGYLVGEQHRGLAYMFHMMNEARVGVGLGATALGYTGYLHSLAYARQRLQGRRVSAKDPATPQVPIIEHPDVKRMLLAQKSYVEGALALNLYCARLLDEQKTGESDEDRAQARLLLDVLTPIAKSWPSQWCLEANSLAIQVLGGTATPGSTRSSSSTATTGSTRSTRGRTASRRWTCSGARWSCRAAPGCCCSPRRLAAPPSGRRRPRGARRARGQLRAAADRVVTTTAGLFRTGDVEAALANASLYLEAVGHVVLAWIWLEQLLAADGRRGGFYDGKRQAGRYFFRWELPKTGPALTLLDRLDSTSSDTDPSWF